MTLLLDTHVFLWWRLDAPNLPANLRAAIAEPKHDVLVSAVVAWEIVIKRRLGKLEFDGTISDAVKEEGFKSLPILGKHVDEVARLPDHHRDPFDRLLVAQARCEGVTLITTDSSILQYGGFVRLAP